MKTPNEIIREWKDIAALSPPFRTTGGRYGGGANDGRVYDARNVPVVDCLGSECAADIVAAALNLAYTYNP